MAMNPTNDGGFMERMIRAKNAVAGAPIPALMAVAPPPPLMAAPSGVLESFPPLMPPPSLMDGSGGGVPPNVPPPTSIPPPPSASAGDDEQTEKESEKPSMASDGSFLQKMLAKAAEEKKAAEDAERKRLEVEERRAATVALDNARREQEAAERLQKSINKETTVVENAFGDDSDSEEDEVDYDMSTVRKTVAYIFEAKDWKGRLEKLKVKSKSDKRLGFIIDRACPEGKAFVSQVQSEEAKRMTSFEDDERDRKRSRRN